MKYISNRYPHSVGKWIDKVSYILMYPWVTAVSFCVACYITSPLHLRSFEKKLLYYLILGPILLCVSVILLPLGILGVTLWLLLCSIVQQENYTFVKYEFGKTPKSLNACETLVDGVVTSDSLTHTVGAAGDASDHLQTRKTYVRKRRSKVKPDNESDALNCTKAVYTFATANVLLGPEILTRLNNNYSSFLRVKDIGKRIMEQGVSAVFNLVKEDNDYFEIKNCGSSISTHFPNIDFICFQEVFERVFALALIDQLKTKYSYFLYDIGEYKWKTNRCALGSGLMFASRFPILDADFHTFSYRTKHAKYVCNGVLCVKVLLGYSPEGVRHIGFVSNLHAQAFQAENAVVYSQLSEVLMFVKSFKEITLQPSDVVDFDVICGDFNTDNMSPGDADVQNHPLMEEYRDICAAKPGRDLNWAIGTELRQMTLFDPRVRNPRLFKAALENDVDRRLFVLDADVVIHTPDLMYAVAKPDPDGLVSPLPWGGRRRVDKILLSNSVDSLPVGYCFVTALGNLTDHVPVCMSLQIERSTTSLSLSPV